MDHRKTVYGTIRQEIEVTESEIVRLIYYFFEKNLGYDLHSYLDKDGSIRGRSLGSIDVEVLKEAKDVTELDRAILIVLKAIEQR